MTDSGKQEPASRLRVLLVNNSPIAMRGLAEIVSEQNDMAVVGQVPDPAAAIEALPGLAADVVVIDVTAKGSGGAYVIRQLRLRQPNLIVLVLSIHDESFYAEYLLRAGANGYMTLNEPPDQLVTAIRRAHSTGIYVSEKVAEGIVSRFVDNGRGNGKGSLMSFFSERELEVFEYLGQGLTVRQIADKLHRSVKTVEAHRENIKKKLRLTNTTELLRNAIHWVEYRREA
jgi:DNA-binding NarL/FixJ family response regulator